jgi:hypothetical protein
MVDTHIHMMRLETKPTSTKSDHALAAANIRRELDHAFPGIKFAVRSRSYAGGDSVDIRWELGPTSKQVEAITGKYQEGSFNGMIDLYEYDTDRSWTAKHGSAKYVFCQRAFADAQQTVEDQLGQLYQADNTCDLQTSAWRILENSAFPPNAIVTGIEHTERSSGLIQDVFRATYIVHCRKCGTNGPHYCPADIARD